MIIHLARLGERPSVTRCGLAADGISPRSVAATIYGAKPTLDYEVMPLLFVSYPSGWEEDDAICVGCRPR